jgi:hypothetical protein
MGKHLGRPRVVVNAARIAVLRAQGLSWREIAAATGHNGPCTPRGTIVSTSPEVAELLFSFKIGNERGDIRLAFRAGFHFLNLSGNKASQLRSPPVLTVLVSSSLSASFQYAL